MDNYYDIQEYLLESWNQFGNQVKEKDSFSFEVRQDNLDTQSFTVEIKRVKKIEHSVAEDKNIAKVLADYYFLDNGVSAKNKCTVLRDYIQNKDLWNVSWEAKESDLTTNERIQTELQKNQNDLKEIHERYNENLKKNTNRGKDNVYSDFFSAHALNTELSLLTTKRMQIEEHLYTLNNPSAFFCTVLRTLINKSLERCVLLQESLQLPPDELTVQVEVSEQEQKQRLTVQDVLDKRQTNKNGSLKSAIQQKMG